MNTTSTAAATQISHEHAIQVAATIRHQVGIGVLMSLGAHDFLYAREGSGALIFKARILPFNKGGKRSERPRIMEVRVAVNSHDYYDISVGYLKGFDWVTHYETTDVDAATIGRRMLALDYDGTTATNPRYL